MSIANRVYFTLLASALLTSFLHGNGGRHRVALGPNYSLDDDPGLYSYMSIGIALSPPLIPLLLTLTMGVLARLVFTTIAVLYTLFAQSMAALRFVRSSLTFSLGALVLFGPFDCCFGWLVLGLATRHAMLVWSMCITNAHWVVPHPTIISNIWAHTFVKNISHQDINSPAAELLAVSILAWLSFFKSEAGIRCVYNLWCTVNPSTYEIVRSSKTIHIHPIPVPNYQEINTKLSIEANAIATMKCREIPEAWMRMLGGWSAHYLVTSEAALVHLIDSHPNGKGLRNWLEMREQSELAWDLYRTGRKAVQAIPGALDIQDAYSNPSPTDIQATANPKAPNVSRTVYQALSKLLRPLWHLLALLHSPESYPWVRVSHLSPTNPPPVTDSQPSPQTLPTNGPVSNNTNSQRRQRTLFSSSSASITAKPASEAPSHPSPLANQLPVATKPPRITLDFGFTQGTRPPLCHRWVPRRDIKPGPVKRQLPDCLVGPPLVSKEPSLRPTSEAQEALSGGPTPLPTASTSIRPDDISTGHPQDDDLEVYGACSEGIAAEQVLVPVNGFDGEVVAITSNAPSIDTHTPGQDTVSCARPAALYKGNAVSGPPTEMDTRKTTHLVIRSGHLVDRSVHPYRRATLSRAPNADKDEPLESLLFPQGTVSSLVPPFSWMSIKEDDPDTDTEMDLDVDMVDLDLDGMNTPDTTMSSPDMVDLDTFDRPTTPLPMSTGILSIPDSDTSFWSTPRANTIGYNTSIAYIWSTSSPLEHMASAVTTTPTTTPPASIPWFQQAPAPNASTWGSSGSDWTTPVRGPANGLSYWGSNEEPCADQTWGSFNSDSTWTTSPRQAQDDDWFARPFESTTPPWTPADKTQLNDQDDDWQTQDVSDTFTSPLAATLEPDEAPWTIGSSPAGEPINATGYGLITAEGQVGVNELTPPRRPLPTFGLASALTVNSGLNIIVEVSEDEEDDEEGDEEEEEDELDAVEGESDTEEEDGYESGEEPALFAWDYASANAFLAQMQGEGLLGPRVST